MRKLTLGCVLALLGSVIAHKDLDLFNAAKDGNLAEVKQALSTGANPNWKNPDYEDGQLKRHWSALHVASRYNYPAVVSALLDAGADINLQDIYGSSPIFVASKYGSMDVVTVLVESSVDINIKLDGWTVLHEAAHKNQPTVISILLDAGANINEQDGIGRTPIYLASENGATDAVAKLIERGANIHITDFTNRSGSVSSKWLSGQTPLMVASYFGHLAIVEALIGAHANLRKTSYNGRTALHWAASRNRIDIALLLLQKGADATQEDNDGNTPASIARAAWDTPFLELANAIESFTGPIDPPTTANPTALITVPTISATLYYDLSILACGVAVFIAETLYMALHLI